MSSVRSKKPQARAVSLRSLAPRAPSDTVTVLSALIGMFTVVVIGAGLADAIPLWLPASQQLWLTAAAYGVPAIVVALIYTWVARACRD